MNLPYLTETAINAFIHSALNEDVGGGDHSSKGSISNNETSSAELLIKDEGILAGIELAQKIFHAVDPGLKVNSILKDGDQVHFGDVGFTVTGKARSILTAERLVLNCLQRMSGIATKTAQLKKLVNHTNAELLDTRKTTPNARIIEKWAVAIGGGRNHRFGLYDMVMLKDNHIDFAGGITQAVNSTFKYLQQENLNLKIEVETRNLSEVEEALETGKVDRIMLDNFEVGVLMEAVDIIGGRVEVEASGGITEETISRVAETGVDYISVGALTHSFRSLDISLKAK
ncbi:MAG: carboxylating nicotinate-nucleotide diphosphorylase [Bacteroidetes bacterium]|nr:carboxylating nicotinate-nucleotide diphosphorylase [Bacteroidota bacterium]MDA1121708.1 carboxylating nicotinate-nucleotide diphosphorylase [Bacteroidota bacterium]